MFGIITKINRYTIKKKMLKYGRIKCKRMDRKNYRIHTDAIKNNLLPKELTKNQINFVYAEEADVLNMALFGMTAKE